jgi:hypothetical protein
MGRSGLDLAGDRNKVACSDGRSEEPSGFIKYRYLFDNLWAC